MVHTKPDREAVSIMRANNPRNQPESTSSSGDNTRLSGRRGPSPDERAIFIVGPSSSGKTTLCNALAARCGIPPSRYIKEVARTVMREQGFTREDVRTFEMQMVIMTAQMQAETSVLAMASRTDNQIRLLSDRSAIDPIVYAGMPGTMQALEIQSRLRCLPGFEKTLSSYRRALFEWIEEDGIRTLEDPWKYCEKLRSLLRELEIPFREIGEDHRDIATRVRLVQEWASSVSNDRDAINTSRQEGNSLRTSEPQL